MPEFQKVRQFCYSTFLNQIFYLHENSVKLTPILKEILQLNLKAAFISQKLIVNSFEIIYGAWLGIVLKIGRFGQQIRNTWKVFKCGTGEFNLDTAISTYNKQLGRLE